MVSVRCLAALLFAFALTLAHAGPLLTGDEITLWGKTLPAGSASRIEPSATTSAPAGNVLHNNIAAVVHPALIAFVPEKPNGTSMIVVPGGSYTKLVAGKEGADIARWLNSLGITAFVLLHRLPNEGHADGRKVVLQDGQRAIRLLRQHAPDWQLDPAKIGIMGFSAGGNLAAATGTGYEIASYRAMDATDAISPKPDFMALIYPAVGMPASHGVAGMQESRAAFLEYATDEIPRVAPPPAFMMIAADDSLTRGAVRFWLALAQANNPPELHVAAKGGHGFALKPDAAPSVRNWPQLFETWLKAKGFLAP